MSEKNPYRDQEKQMTQHCRLPKPCRYFDAYCGCCSYFYCTGMRRPCGPGDACTVKDASSPAVLPRSNPNYQDMIQSFDLATLSGREAAFMVLYRQKLSDPKIAKYTKTNKNTVLRWRRKNHLPPNATGRPMLYKESNHV